MTIVTAVGARPVAASDISASVVVGAAITGTATPTSTETDIVNGGRTIIITLTNDTWVDAGFNGQRQAIIDGLDAATTPATGWNNEVRDKEVVGAVVRTSATVATITLSASGAYDITATETITVTVPASALVLSTSDVVGDVTFTVTAVAVADEPVAQVIVFEAGKPMLIRAGNTF